MYQEGSKWLANDMYSKPLRNGDVSYSFHQAYQVSGGKLQIWVVLTIFAVWYTQPWTIGRVVPTEYVYEAWYPQQPSAPVKKINPPTMCRIQTKKHT